MPVLPAPFGGQGAGGGSEGATAVPDVPGWCLWPHVRARWALYEGFPIRTSGQIRCVPRGRSMGNPSALPRVQWVGQPGVIAVPLPHLVGFHRPSPHAQYARSPLLTWDSQVVR